MLSVRQVTGLLQQYSAERPAQDGELMYPHLLDMLCRCAVVLRQQVQRKLSGPWVNITEVGPHSSPQRPSWDPNNSIQMHFARSMHTARLLSDTER